MVKFLLDRMLGQTAKWLRLMGVDAEYAPEVEDDKLLQIAREEGRIIITRDKELARSEGVFLVPKATPEETIRLMLREFDIDIEPMTRCSKCNSSVESVDKETVKDSIPEGVLERCDEYWRCSGCSQIYWKGTHWDEIMATINGILELVKGP